MASKVHRRNRRPRVCVCDPPPAADFIYVRGMEFVGGDSSLILYLHSVVTLGSLADFNAWNFEDFNGPLTVDFVSVVAPGKILIHFDSSLTQFAVWQPPADSPAVEAAGPIFFPAYAFICAGSV